MGIHRKTLAASFRRFLKTCAYGLIAHSSAADSQKFHELYQSHLPAITIQKSPGTYAESPLTLGVLASNSYWLIGSFEREPTLGGGILLRDPFGHNGILGEIWNTQHFSGYRWFWHGEIQSFQSPPSGGYYDLSSVTLPSSPSMTLENHILRLSWQNPNLPAYGTRVSYRVSPNRSLMLSSQDGQIVYDGFGASASAITRPGPGNWVQVAFYGMKEIGPYRIDSGAGVQKILSSLGNVQYSLLHASRYGDGKESRLLLETANARLIATNKKQYKIRPVGAAEPTDPTGNITPWPQMDAVYILKGSYILAETLNDWTNGLSRLYETDPYTAIRVQVPMTRILSADPGVVTVQLDTGWLGAEQACRHLDLSIHQGPGTGLVSNTVPLKLVHGNPWIGRTCRD